MIATFYNHKISKNIVESQKKVFDFFEQEISQVFIKDWVSHGKSVDDYLTNLGNDWEYFILFDIDCIPLTKDIIPEAINWVKTNNGLFSAAQKASHIPNSIIYASPAFVAFNKKTYELLGKPSFQSTNRSDCGAELTYIANEIGLEVKLLYPTEVAIPAWPLTENTMFGFGTNYENKIFHSFESRFNRYDFFIKKCSEVLNG